LGKAIIKGFITLILLITPCFLIAQDVELIGLKTNFEQSTENHFAVPLYSFARGYYDRFGTSIPTINTTSASRYSSTLPKESFWADLDLVNISSEVQFGSVKGMMTFPDGSEHEMNWLNGISDELLFRIEPEESIFLSFTVSPPKNVEAEEGLYFVRLTIDDFVSTYDFTFEVTDDLVNENHNSLGFVNQLDIEQYNEPESTKELIKELAKLWIEVVLLFLEGKAEGGNDPRDNIVDDYYDPYSEAREAALYTSDNRLQINSLPDNNYKISTRWRNRFFLDSELEEVSFYYDRAVLSLDLTSAIDYPIVEPQENLLVENYVDEEGLFHTTLVWVVNGIGKQIKLYEWFDREFIVNSNNDLNVDFISALQLGPFQDQPGTEGGGIYDYQKYVDNPNEVHWLQLSSDISSKSARGDEIVSVNTTNLDVGIEGNIGVNIIPNRDGDY
jgi:hypothetical protein